MLEVKKKIIETVENNKDNVHLYMLIFKILTDDNNIKNYTENANGIFFNMSVIPDEKIKELNEQISIFISRKNNILENENKRSEILNKMTDNIENYYKKDLKDFLKQKEISFSTKLLGDLNDEIENHEEEKNKKPLSNKQHKKSIDFFLKPKKFSGCRDRINKILKSSKSGRVRNKMLKSGYGEEIDTDGLYCHGEDDEIIEDDGEFIERGDNENTEFVEDDEDLFGEDVENEELEEDVENEEDEEPEDVENEDVENEDVENEKASVM